MVAMPPEWESLCSHVQTGRAYMVVKTCQYAACLPRANISETLLSPAELHRSEKRFWRGGGQCVTGYFAVFLFDRPMFLMT